MFVDFLLDRFAESADSPAVHAPAGSCSFAELGERYERWDGELERQGIGAGAVVALEADFSPNAVALFVALVGRAAIIVLESNRRKNGNADRDDIAQVEWRCVVDAGDRVGFERSGRDADHPLYGELRRRGNPGVVGFSSGTSGEPKAAVNDLTPILATFHTRRSAFSTFAFLLWDHLGGMRTMLHSLSNSVTLVATHDRSPETICDLVERHRVELLPATPSFFNLLLLSGAHRRHDLSSLRVISYGAEPMPQSTLDRLRKEFPGVKLQQTYGLIEIGALSTKSREDGSLWVKVGGRGFETRVRDGILQIRSQAMTLGYLNAPTPITPDGWFVTGDAVQEEGEYLRFLGRRSELINVGGKKVAPVEVESVIQSMPGIEEATAYGEDNALLGQIVCATVHAPDGGDARQLARDVKSFCRERLDRFKVPVRVKVVSGAPDAERVKKSRREGTRTDGDP